MYSSKGAWETCPPTPFKFSPILLIYNIDESRSHRVEMGDSYSKESKIFSQPRITPNGSNLNHRVVLKKPRDISSKIENRQIRCHEDIEGKGTKGISMQ